MARANLKRAPGPRRWSPFGSLPELRRDPLATLLQARAEYGDVVRFRSGIWHACLVAHPDDVKRVLQDNADNYTKGFVFDYLKTVLGRGLLTDEGESWRQQRRLVQPAFQHQRLREMTDAINASIQRMLARWREAPAVREVDLAQEMTSLTLDIVTNAVIGSPFASDGGAVSEAVRVAQEHINWQIMRLLTWSDRIPTPRNRRFKRALSTLNDAVYALLDERRRELAAQDESASGATRRTDLLTLLIEALDVEGSEHMTEMQLRDEVMTILLAGHETTANALVWAWHFIAANSEVAERLRAEVDAVLGGRHPCLADLAALEYTGMVFDEALRLRPPVWALFRCPLTDDALGGYRVPSFTTIILSPYLTHRHPEFWDDPERFDPERFDPSRAAGRPRYAFFPFGGGPRMCLGGEFATMEGIMALASMAQEFELEALPGHEVALEPLITLRPAGGLPMIVRRRKDA